MRAEFCMKFYITVKPESIHFTTYFLSNEYLKMTELCCFNQGNQYFSALEHRAELSELDSRVYWAERVAPNYPKFECDDLKQVWDAMLKKYHKLQRKPKTTDELKVVLETIWEDLPQEHINKALANFTKRLNAYTAASTNDAHFEHLQ